MFETIKKTDIIKCKFNKGKINMINKKDNQKSNLKQNRKDFAKTKVNKSYRKDIALTEKKQDDKFKTKSNKAKKVGTAKELNNITKNGKSKNTLKTTLKQNKKAEEKPSTKNLRTKKDYTQLFIVNHSTTLMEFLLEKCKTSRNTVKHLLSGNKVLVNGSVVSQYNFPLVKDDEIKLSKRSVNYGINAKLPKTNIQTKIKLPFNIIYEDEDFIGIDKSAGLLSVESDNEKECAYAYMLKYFQSKDKNLRPYILHRIDKETSGVLIFAKNPKIHSMLKLNWNDFVKTREYYALVEGKPEKQEGTIVTYLKENAYNMVYSTLDKTGQKSITHFKVEKTNETYSLLKVNIDTGRKNQIRVHMQNIHHPICGDEKYGCEKDPLNRLGLHASKLEFIHPIKKELISISAKVPDSFYKVVNSKE